MKNPWIASIIEIDECGNHQYKVINVETHEVHFGRIKSNNPVHSVLPTTFFDAIKTCIEEFEKNPTRVVIPTPTIDIVEDDTIARGIKRNNWSPGFLYGHYNYNNSDDA